MTDFPTLFVFTTLYGKLNQVDDYKEIIKANIDVCDIQKGAFGSVVSAALQEGLNKFSNFKFGCPIKKQFYYATNFPFPDTVLFPKFLLKQSGYWKLIGSVKCKFSRKKPMEHIFNATVTGFIMTD